MPWLTKQIMLITPRTQHDDTSTAARYLPTTLVPKKSNRLDSL